MIYEVYRRPSRPPPRWLMNAGAVVVCLVGVVIVAAIAAVSGAGGKDNG